MPMIVVVGAGIGGVRWDGPQGYLDYTSWRGVTGNADWLRLAFETWGRGARFGAMPIRAGHAMYWFATANAAEGGTDNRARAALGSRFGSWHAPIPELLAATDDTALVRPDIYDRPRTPAWTSGPIALLGDAAHAPNLGQGASQAREDAEALAANLTRGAYQRGARSSKLAPDGEGRWEGGIRWGGIVG